MYTKRNFNEDHYVVYMILIIHVHPSTREVKS